MGIEYDIVELRLATENTDNYYDKNLTYLQHQEIDRQTFIKLVNDRCREGWEPIGGISYVDQAEWGHLGSGPFVYSQAIIRRS